MLLALTILVKTLLLSGCSQGPKGLEGTWKMDGIVPMTVIYRSDEEEAMGIISKVSYEHQGTDILITYESGMMEGNSVRLTKVDENTYRSEFGLLKRRR